MAKASDAKRVAGGVMYRGKKYPGFNKPKRYSGSGKYKKTVLAKKGDQIKVVNYGHKSYGHKQTIGLVETSGQGKAGVRKVHQKNDATVHREGT